MISCVHICRSVTDIAETTEIEELGKLITLDSASGLVIFFFRFKFFESGSPHKICLFKQKIGKYFR